MQKISGKLMQNFQPDISLYDCYIYSDIVKFYFNILITYQLFDNRLNIAYNRICRKKFTNKKKGKISNLCAVTYAHQEVK